MIEPTSITVHQVEYHRNGVGGMGFYAVIFDDGENGPMIGTVFADDLDRTQSTAFFNAHCAVFSLELLPDVTFGENSWRGDHYFDFLVEAVKRVNAKLDNLDDSVNWLDDAQKVRTTPFVVTG